MHVVIIILAEYLISFGLTLNNLVKFWTPKMGEKSSKLEQQNLSHIIKQEFKLEIVRIFQNYTVCHSSFHIKMK